MKRTNIAGFTMMELLASLVVLSIGLLGLAALQATSIRHNHDSYLRSMAVSQANDMAERIRANRVGWQSGMYDNLSGMPGSPPSCTNCNPSDSAQLDLYEWNYANGGMMPNGQGQVVAAGNLFNITLFWDNDRTGATGTNCSGDSSVDLSCVTIAVQP